MKVYIAGLISNGGVLAPEKWEANMAMFAERASWLETHGYEPVNPCEIKGDSDWSWRDYMRASLALLLLSDGISLLPGWEQSRGARIEWDLARQLDYPVVGP